MAFNNLERFDNVSEGKYTVGLGQKNMAFVEPYEDVNSLALTVVQHTLEKYKIDAGQIGRLEVGTETLLDKSKSTKTVLMQLFRDKGNNDIEGITSINACYGGTAALFNTLAWVESSAYDGERLGCVVTVDVAVYKKGPARPTGGSGAICMIVGPNAPFVVEPIRSTFMDHAYDFYKPDPRSEFPTVDGKLSINTYLTSIDNNYHRINQKCQESEVEQFTLQNIHYGCFHAPFAKMVQKAYVRLVYNDLLRNGVSQQEINTSELAVLQSRDYDSKEVKSLLARVCKKSWEQKVKRSLFMGENLGNIYTGSLYAGLSSLICDETVDLLNKRVVMFSYGSGLASSMFVIKVVGEYANMRRVLDLKQRLSSRVKVPIEEYDRIMAEREAAFGQLPKTPQVNFTRLDVGTFYLSSIDSMWRRQYTRILPANQTEIPAQVVPSKNNCSSSNNNNNNNNNRNNSSDGKSKPQPADVKTASKTNPDTLKEQKIRLAERLEQFKKQIVDSAPSQSIASTPSLSEPNNAQNTASNSTVVVSKKRAHQSDKNLNAKIWAGFYKKTLRERLDQIKKVEPSIDTKNFLDGGLALERAELMVENCVGKLSLPLGLGLNFKINEKYYTIPMVTEEPSVIAAASSAAKFIDENGGGLLTYSTRPIMIGQIQMLDVNPLQLQFKIDQNKDKLIAYANEICQNMVNRGGGVVDIKVRTLSSQGKDLKPTGTYEIEEMAVVDFYVNVCDSMGANIINTILEYVAPFLEKLIGTGRVGLKILSNLCTERKALAEFEIPISKMGWKDMTGEQVSRRMIEGYRFAQLDPFRASTHNKGIFNGMDAVAIATGQDWRSIESSSHAYASQIGQKLGSYQPLTHYQIVPSKKQKPAGNNNNELVFHGSIEIPISVGSQGGVLNSNALYQNNLRLLGFPNAQQLSEIIAAVGLCQNFAALRALAVEGIQKGHMGLHGRNIAISGGVPTHLVEEATRFMQFRKKMNVDTAKAYLSALDLFEQVRQDDRPDQAGTNNNTSLGTETSSRINTKDTSKQALSTFYVELDCEQIEDPIVLHIALDCFVGEGQQPIHLSIEPAPKNPINPAATGQTNEISLIQQVQKLLFGSKGSDWLVQIFSALEIVSLNMNKSHQLSQQQQHSTLVTQPLKVSSSTVITANSSEQQTDTKQQQPQLQEQSIQSPLHVPSKKLVYKLKLIAIIIDLLASNLMALDDETTMKVIEKILSHFKQEGQLMRKFEVNSFLKNKKQKKNQLNSEEDTSNTNSSAQQMALTYGLTLLTECMLVFEYNVDNTKINDANLKNALLEELCLILESQVTTQTIWTRIVHGQSAVQSQPESKNASLIDTDAFLVARQKRLCATMMLFCDCVHLSNSRAIPTTTFAILRRLGGIYEVEITLAHDLTRWKQNLNELNYYSVWLLKNNRFEQGHNPETRAAFISEIFSALNRSKQQLYPQLDEKLRILADITSEVIRSFYNINEKLILSKPAL